MSAVHVRREFLNFLPPLRSTLLRHRPPRSALAPLRPCPPPPLRPPLSPPPPSPPPPSRLPASRCPRPRTCRSPLPSIPTPPCPPTVPRPVPTHPAAWHAFPARALPLSGSNRSTSRSQPPFTRRVRHRQAATREGARRVSIHAAKLPLAPRPRVRSVMCAVRERWGVTMSSTSQRPSPSPGVCSKQNLKVRLRE